MKRKLLLVCVAAIVSGCSAHSPMIVKNTTNVSPVGAERRAAHTNPVLIIEGPLPADVQYEVLATIDVGKVWYSGADGIPGEMAKRAREIGADAVINVKKWRQPSGFALAAPHAQGQAVKILNKDKRDLSGMGKLL